MDNNDTADLIRDTLGPTLGEFMDGYAIAGFKAGTQKKLMVVKMPENDKNKADMIPIIQAFEEWGNVHIDV